MFSTLFSSDLSREAYKSKWTINSPKSKNQEFLIIRYSTLVCGGLIITKFNLLTRLTNIHLPCIFNAWFRTTVRILKVLS